MSIDNLIRQFKDRISLLELTALIKSKEVPLLVLINNYVKNKSKLCIICMSTNTPRKYLRLPKLAQIQMTRKSNFLQ